MGCGIGNQHCMTFSISGHRIAHADATNATRYNYFINVPDCLVGCGHTVTIQLNDVTHIGDTGDGTFCIVNR